MSEDDAIAMAARAVLETVHQNGWTCTALELHRMQIVWLRGSAAGMMRAAKQFEEANPLKP